MPSLDSGADADLDGAAPDEGPPDVLAHDAAPSGDAAADQGANDAAVPDDDGGCVAAPELCDGVDNDCDLDVDEDFPLGGECSPVGRCQRAEVQCNADGTAKVCIQMDARPEFCNGLDDDCDGEVDDGCTRCGAEDSSQPCNGCPEGTLVPDGFVCVRGGTYRMGAEDGADNERPPHRVQVPGFLLARTELTVTDYAACVRAGQCSEATGYDAEVPEAAHCNWGRLGHEDHPVNCIDWRQASTFAAWAGARLPSEAEWEYAARSGGGSQTYPWGDAEPNCVRAMMNEGNAGCGDIRTARVCSRPDGDSTLGLCDMAGNVWDMVEDCAHDYEDAPRDGSAFTGCGDNGLRVQRGGSWFSTAEGLRVSTRSWVDRGQRPSFAGFRLAATLPCAPNERRACGVGACGGEQICQADRTWRRCPPGLPAPEICNGVDDDCDGEPDEDFEPGARCQVGVGACARAGALACTEAQDGVECVGEPGAPDVDDATCDGVDNDCDGSVDEDYAPRETSCGEGACAAAGRTFCVGGDEQDSCAPGEPAGADDGTCDGVDDDCDGLIDEDYAPERCGVGVCVRASVCADGAVIACTPGEPAGADDGTCDGVDDDCDGEVDEDCTGCAAGDNAPPCNGCPVGTVVPAGWVCIPAGEYVMGSPGAECPDGACLDPRCDTPAGCPDPEPGRAGDEGQHRVRITRSYLLKETEVTRREWGAVSRAEGWAVLNPSQQAQCGDDCPVSVVNWYEAVAYCNALSRAAGLEECYAYNPALCGDRTPGEDMECGAVVFSGPGCGGFRLPTEAEWEYAARAGTLGATYNEEEPFVILGDRNAPNLDPIAWYGGNSGAEYADGNDCSGWPERQYPDAQRCGPHPAARKAPNAWGLYDLLGNLGEWVGDGYRGDYGGAGDPAVATDDPRGYEPGADRVTRGGTWFTLARYARAPRRTPAVPGYRNGDVGLRPARRVP